MKANPRKQTACRHGEFILELFSMMNKPTEFFKQDLSLARGVFYFLMSALLFTTLTQTLVYYGIIPATLETTFGMSILINFFSIVAGFCLIAAILIGVDFLMGGKNQIQCFIAMLHSISPLLLLVWIPFIFLQFIVLVWSLALLMVSFHDKEKYSYRRSIIFPVLFISLVIIFTYVSRNYILLGWLKP